MPFVNIENSGKGNNKGSCRALVNYLCKENEGKSLTQREHFFSESDDQVNRLQVITAIDGNVKKLGKNDSKFFMLTVNFSKSEIEHLKNDPSKIQEYSREVMDLYAKNFNKGLSSSDLVWFAKIEYQRTFKGFEQEVLNGLNKQGELKPGLNTHVHFIIGRKDRSQRLKLSPMTNHRRSTKGIIKVGFDRTNFKKECESYFDKAFAYKRLPSDHFIVANMLKNGTRDQKINLRQSIYNKQNPLTSTLNLLGGTFSHYPLSEEELREKRKNRDQEQSY